MLSESHALGHDDDWRLEVDVGQEHLADWLAAVVAAQTLEHDLSVAFQDRIIATQEGTRIFFYAASREQCKAVARAVEVEVSEQGWDITTDMRQWHPLAEDWEASDVPLPRDPESIEAERVIRMTREQAETAARGYPEFEVRVDLPSHRDARSLSDRLEKEGLSPVRRWRYVLIGVTDEITGEALAERIRSVVPAGSRARVEGTITAARSDLRSPRPNPFAVISENKT
jgi:hypothetical protein